MSQPCTGNDNKTEIIVPSPVIARPSFLSSSKRRISSGRPMATTADVIDRDLHWNVNNDQLRPLPNYYPPLNPHCTAFVVDTKASAIAERISQCLKERSIAAEYNDELHSATCMTADRVHFTVQLYRGERAIIVECSRMNGSVISFHRTCRSILDAAMGVSAGDELRKPLRTSPLEFPRLIKQLSEDDSHSEQVSQPPAKRLASSPSSQAPPATPKSSPILAIEGAMALLRKDRFCAQRLGMESLVLLTDEYTSNTETANFASLAVLGSSDGSNSTNANDTLHQLHDLIGTVIQKRKLPTEIEEEEDYTSGGKSVDDVGASAVVEPSNEEVCLHKCKAQQQHPRTEEDEHCGIIRCLALRVLTNALVLLSRKQSVLLRSILSKESSQNLVGEALLASLVDDLSGSERPPSAFIGTRLASSHEAALAAVCLGILAKHSNTAHQYLVGYKQNETNSICRHSLEKAREIGRHSLLSKEADRTQRILYGI